MGLKTTCDGCGRGVVGVFSSLRNVNGRYLCPTCAANPTAMSKYYCNSCHNYSPTALMKGNGWIELVLYLLYIIPGIIYSVWRRSGQPNVCPLCKVPGLVPAGVAKPEGPAQLGESREEVECPHCAEKILAKAKICKHCGKQVRI
jgi:DNA-directed RNA polymerase subunit RPC12/RpoP